MTATATDNALMEAALDYARRGWRVIPLHNQEPDGSCSCARPDCPANSHGKHPRELAWQTAASTDEAVIERWWTQCPLANVGVVFGPDSGVIDIETDSPEEERVLLDLFGGDVPITPCFASSRGKHRLFRYRADLPQTAVHYIAKLGIRIGSGKGAMSVFPPSQHPSGATYTWIISPDECDPAGIPDAVHARIVNGERGGDNGNSHARKPAAEYERYAQGVDEGERDTCMLSLIGKLLRQQADLSDDALEPVFECVRAVNERNMPPLPDEKVRRHFREVLKKERARRGVNGHGHGANGYGGAGSGGHHDGRWGEPEPEERTPIEYRRLTCRELDEGDFALEYLVENTLVAGQPCVIAGGKKSLKTSLLIDLGISLAMGGYFLGHLKTNRAAHVGIMTGESGLATIQETARRICRAAGYDLRDIDGLVFSDDLPRFGSVEHEDAVRRFLENDELEVLCIDPAYLSLPGADAANLFVQGELLRGMAKVCSDAGCMLVLCHHTKKTKVDPFAPPELEDISWSGFQEWCRQWLLVGRRERYEPGTGEHKLWLNVGGSAGHSALWALDINEGIRETLGGRFWDVNLLRAEEAREAVRDAKTRLREQEAEEKLQKDKTRVVCALANQRFSAGATATELRPTVGMSGDRFGVVVSALVDDGMVVPCDVFKPPRRSPYQGYTLARQTNGPDEGIPGFSDGE